MDEDAGEAFFYGGNMKEIRLTQGLVAIVDDDDFYWLNQFKWHPDSKGYAVRTAKKENGKQTTIKMHREIVGLIKCEGFNVDHINEVKRDNRRSNLRICSDTENQRNRKKTISNKSGFKGVSWNKSAKKWNARISINGKKKHIGYFEKPEYAHEAYKKAALENFGEFANFGGGCEILAKDS